ncbi:MAG: hypothetical protein HY726_00740 [Candidatus Rokubacteria bacterium]|nr:hypothetical protein [Candidatus Rokubacteria bacterium]
MSGRGPVVLLSVFFVSTVMVSGCVSLRELAGFPAESTPSVSRRTTEARWVLIKNPRFGSVPSEPEYVWTEEDKIPWTATSVVFGKRAILAPPEIVEKYGSPPGGGKISPLQGGPYAAERAAQRPSGSSPRAEARAEARPTPAGRGGAVEKADASARLGYVVFVDTNRVVIDLTAQDGLRPGSVVSLRRNKIPIIHPITGELLGELDEEVATGKVVEVRERFSVVEIQSSTPGNEIRVKDRVTLR